MQSIRQYRQLRQHLEGRLGKFRETHPDISLPTTDEKISGALAEHIPGVSVSARSDGSQYFSVSVADEDRLIQPKRWSRSTRWRYTGIVALTGMLVSASSAIDSLVAKQVQEEFHISAVAEALAGTGVFLIAFGFGSLLSGPFSETVGRNPVYIASLLLFMVFVMASGLSTGVATQLVFRFFAGFFGCTPLTTFGGSVSDMWNQVEKTYVFPVCACLSFLGPFLAPLVSAYIGQSSLVSWRWVEWVILIFGGIVTSAIILFVPETYTPVLAGWKANHLRKLTGDDRYLSEAEVRQSGLPTRLARNIYRPFKMFLTEAPVVFFTIYMAVVYIVLFTFLTGYDFLYGNIYGFSQGQVGLAFIGMNIGFLIALVMAYPIYLRYKRTAKSLEPQPVPPAERLWYAMLGAPWLPISLFWMAWTSFSSISYWSCLVASVAFGFSVQGIFITSYQYLIDAYEEYAASALVAMTFVRYVVAGGMTVVANPMYENLGVHWALTVLACISLVMTPVPYVFYWRDNKRVSRDCEGGACMKE